MFKSSHLYLPPTCLSEREQEEKVKAEDVEAQLSRFFFFQRWKNVIGSTMGKRSLVLAWVGKWNKKKN